MAILAPNPQETMLQPATFKEILKLVLLVLQQRTVLRGYVLGRSLQHRVGFLDEIHTKRVHLYLHQQGVDTTTPAGRALFQMTGVFAEFKRAMIQARVNAGLTRVRSQGRTLGQPKILPQTERAILKARRKGTGMIAIAKEVGCGVGTVQRILNDNKT